MSLAGGPSVAASVAVPAATAGPAPDRGPCPGLCPGLIPDHPLPQPPTLPLGQGNPGTAFVTFILQQIVTVVPWFGFLQWKFSVAPAAQAAGGIKLGL